MPSASQKLRELGMVRGWVRGSAECDETLLSTTEREALAAIRCVFSVVEQLQPVTVYGATYQQVYAVLVSAQESLNKRSQELTKVEYTLAFQALLMAFDRVKTIAKERGQ